MTSRAELSSVATGLDELVNRISGIVESLTGEDRDQVGPDLFEVERSLRAAQRRMRRIMDASSR